MAIRSAVRTASLFLPIVTSLTVAQDFGQRTIGSGGVTATLSYSFTGLSAAPRFTLAWQRDFQAATPACSVGVTTSCTIAITFTPIRPGLRQDGLIIKDAFGRLLRNTLLHGIGQSPYMVLYPGIISTLSGNGVWGYQDSPDPTAAMFRSPQGITLDGSGSAAYVADSVNGVVRKIVLASGAVTTVAGNGSNGLSGDGGPATGAMLNTPTGVAVDGVGNLYVADMGNNLIRKVDALTQVITTVAGGGTGASGSDGLGDGGPARSAILYGPQSVAVDTAGTLYIADTYNNLVRSVNATTGTISVVAGGGTSPGTDGFGNGGAAVNAQLSYPAGVALDSSGNLYIADMGNNMIRRVDMAFGLISAVAGNGTWGYSGDFGPASSAALASPQGVAVDAANNLYIADYGNNAIRQVSSSSRRILTVAGRVSTGYSGDGGNPTLAFLTSPTGIAVGENSVLYIADYGNNVIRQVTFPVPSFAFPDEPVGALSAAQTVSPINAGNLPLSLSGLSVSAGFQQTLLALADCAPGISLPPGGSCDAAVSFAPSQSGATTGTLRLTSDTLNTANSVQTVNLSGNALAGRGPVVTLSAGTLTFPGQLVGTTSASQTVTLSNSGGAPFTISNIWLSGAEAADFRLTTTCPASLPAAASCTVGVTFTPSVGGTRTTTLLFSELVAGSPQSVFVSGFGNGGVVVLNPASLNFTAQIGGASSPQTVLVSNTGSFPLHILSIALSGASANQFSLTGTCGSTVAPGATCALNVSFSPTAAGTVSAALTISDDAGDSQQTVTLNGTGSTVMATSGLRFIPVTPCRIADTRDPVGPFGGPVLTGGIARNFPVPASGCGVPAAAQAYSLNFTVVPIGPLGYLSVWPSGQPQPPVSLLNSDGRVKANAAIVPAGTGGAIAVFGSQNVHVIIDINGYFVPASNLSALGFYPVTPCRIADTRQTSLLVHGVARNFAPLSAACGLPSTAQAYSLNFTVIPKAPIGFLSTWPAGQPQPPVSTLNTSTTAVTANAAIVPSGTNGNITVYSSADTDLVIDVNGYFAPATGSGVLSLFTIPPCRVLDSRQTSGPISGTIIVNVLGSSCGVAPAVQAFVMNATVVPRSSLGFLSLWQNNAAWPVSSTLNAEDSAVTSNMAIVPTTNGSINSLASSSTDLILDISAYFAP